MWVTNLWGNCGIGALALVLVLSADVGALAQTTTATIEGTVTDTTGAVLRGVTVDVRGATVSRSVVTDEGGFYRAVALPPGTYTLLASLAGFQSHRLQGIDLVVNRTVTINIQLDVATQEEAVEVRADVPPIDVTTSSRSHVVTAATIEAIPINGRNYLDLALLAPGVIVNDNASGALTGRDTRGSILGERAGNAAFLIDGIENNDDFRGGVFQEYTQDAIQEFEIIQAGYKAEFGRGSGGIVNVITKSGTNRTSGSAFFFTRNDAMDASNVEGAEAPELARYNTGLTVGGPVTRDRAWYFGSVEHIFERRASIFPSNVPDVLSAGEDFSTNPETKNYRLFGKYSRRVGTAHDLRTEASWSRLERLNELSGATALPSASNDNDAKTFLGSAMLTSILSPSLLLETSLGYRDQRFGQNQNLTGEGRSYSIFFVDGSGSFAFGPRYGSQLTLDQRYLTARQVLSLFSGDRHAAKAGVEYMRTSVDGENAQGLLNVLVTTRANFTAFGVDSFQIPQGVGFLGAGDELSRLRNHGLSLFAQDDWRVHPRVMANLGVRYDYDSKFGDGNNVAPRLGVVWTPDARTAVRANWGVFYDRYRLGLAQPVPELGGFNGRTVVEINYPRLVADAIPIAAGALGLLGAVTQNPLILHQHFGIPVNAVVTRDNVQSLTGRTPDQFLTELRGLLATVPVAFAPVDFSPSTGFLRQDLAAAFQDVIRVARPFRTPYNSTVTLGAERTVFADVTMGATYVHRVIRNVLGLQLTNLAFESRTAGTVITTDGGPLQRTYGPWYDGDYDALIFSLDKRFNGRYQVQFSYTYAQGKDNLLNSNLSVGVATQGGGAVPTDNLDLEVDRGNSDLVVPHSFVASGVVRLPLDFRVSGVFRASSGVFFTAAGTPRDVDGDGIVSTRPAGTVRNQFNGPESYNTDVRVEKRFTFGRYSAAALVEFFNLFNARNPRLIDNFYTATGPGPTFGEVRVPLPGRETQIGFRFLF